MKTCNKEGCSYPVFSKGRCKYHIDRKSLRKIIRKKTPYNMRGFFLSIWKKRPHYCENCKKWLGNEPLSYMFDHLLEKSMYPDLKYEEDNIMLTCLDCHDQKTKGFASNYIKKRIKNVRLKFEK